MLGVRRLVGRRTETNATTEATRSIEEWSASLRIATEPVTAAAASFSAISTELETIETAAAAGFVIPARSAPRPVGPGRPARGRRGRGG